jgi:hypothetical protein
VRKAVTGLACVFALVACEGSAPHATATLKHLQIVTALHVLPPGAVLIGSGEDRGSNSVISGREPRFVAVFATSRTTSIVEAYYRTAYPQYRLGNSFTGTSEIELIGTDGDIVVDIDISPGQPNIPANVKMTQVRSPMPSQRTYVVVSALATAR